MREWSKIELVPVAWEAMRRSAHIFAVALALAYLEVQIEGPNGWASALPTWRTTDPAVTWIFGGRPVTGYHLALNCLLLLLLHWPFQFTRWTLIAEARVLHAFAVLAVIWDFLWFVINPSFGLERYGAETVWWFRHWFLGVPVDYWLGLGAAVLLRAVPSLFARESLRRALLEGFLGVLFPVVGAAVFALASVVI